MRKTTKGWGNTPRLGGGKILSGRPQKGLTFPEVNVDHAKSCCIAHQFHGAVEVKFAHNIGSVVFNGLRADEKLFCNFFGGKPLCKKMHNLLLPWGEGAITYICDLCLLFTKSH